MWAANAATVTPSADTADGRVHFTPANLLTNLHRSLEGPQTTRSLRRLFPDETRFAVHDPLPAQPHFADEGAANHVRLCAEHGAPGVNLFVWGREAWEHWDGRYPARQTREAFEAVERRHGAARAVFPRQGRAAIDGGAFHNDVVCVGTRDCLFFHERAFEDRAAWRPRSARRPRACSNRPSSRSRKPICRWPIWWPATCSIHSCWSSPARIVWCCWPRPRRATIRAPTPSPKAWRLPTVRSAGSSMSMSARACATAAARPACVCAWC
jgi:hypothetical protein